MSASGAADVKIGNVRAGENDVLWKPVYPVKRTDPPIVLWHGSATPGQWTGGAPAWPACNQLAWRLCREGFVVVSGDFGLETWGNDTAMTAGDNARAYAAAATGCSTTKAIHIGASMGGCNAIRYTIEHGSSVLGLIGMIPLCDLLAFYAANTLGAQAAIGTAWGVTAPAALPSNADIATRASAIKTAGIPSRFFYSAVDPYVPPSTVTAMAATTGGIAGITDHSVGHANGTIAGVSVPEIINFLRAAIG